MVKIRELSSLKKALMIGLLLPEKVNGRKFGSLWSDISFSVRSELQVRKNLESDDQVTPVISSVCRFPYFLYKIIGEYTFLVTSGVSQTLTFFPVATTKNLESGENSRAVTLSLKLKWAITTCFWKLMIRANPSTSIVIRIFLSGETTIRSMLLLFWKGSVRETLLQIKLVDGVSYFVRSSIVSLFPTGLSRSWSWDPVGDIFSANTIFPDV